MLFSFTYYELQDTGYRLVVKYKVVLTLVRGIAMLNPRPPTKPDVVGALMIAAMSPMITFLCVFIGSRLWESPKVGMLCSLFIIGYVVRAIWQTSKLAVILAIVLNAGLLFFILQFIK